MNATVSWLCRDGATVWRDGDFGECFEQLVFSCGASALIAVASSYHLVRHQSRRLRGAVRRSPTLHVRLAASLVPVLLSVVQLAACVWGTASPAAVVTWSMGGVAWSLHAAFLWRLHRLLHVSLRGPAAVVLSALLGCAAVAVQVRSAILSLQKTPDARLADVAVVISGAVHAVYLLTLLASERPPQRHVASLSVNAEDERNALLAGGRGATYGTAPDPEPDLGPGDDSAGCLSWLTLWWVRPLLRRGAAGRLHTAADLFRMPARLTTLAIDRHFADTLEGAASGNPTMLVALHRAFGCEYYAIGVMKLIADGLGFAGPLLLERIVTYMSTSPAPPAWHGYAYAGILFACTLTASMLNVHFNYAVWIVALKIRAAVRTTVYRRVLGASSAALGRYATGEVFNLMSTDVDRIVRICFSFHQFWSLPLQIGVSLYLLHRLIGIAFLAGVIFIILLIPANKWLAKKITQLNKALMARKDARVKMMTEVLNGIRVIKFYAWEPHFARLVGGLRRLEVTSLKGMKYLDALCVYFWATTPVLMSILTFTTYVLLGHHLTAAKVFASIALFNMLIIPLNAFPFVINGIIESWTSLCRVQAFIELPRLDWSTYYHQETELASDEAVRMTGGQFSWSENHSAGDQAQSCSGEAAVSTATADDERTALLPAEENGDVTTGHSQSEHGVVTVRSQSEQDDEPKSPAIASITLRLTDLSFTLKKGSLVGVIGRVGSGKSSLLSALLGEMCREGGRLTVAGLADGFGLVAQEAWVQHATFRDNILCGATFDAGRYADVLDACALRDDLQVLPAGDRTEIGENGVTLSGGQKIRVTLARAIYQDKDIYLLDDPLASVDAHVAQHLFDRCIMGLLRDKTRVLCTHHTRFLRVADIVIRMEDGRIIQAGPPAEVLSASDCEDTGRSAPGQTDDDVETDEEGGAKEGDEDGGLMEEEAKDQGVVKMRVYSLYWKAVGGWLAPLVLIAVLLMQASRNTSDWWLSYWVGHSLPPGAGLNTTDGLLPLSSPAGPPSDRPTAWTNLTSAEDNVRFYLMVYGLISASNSVFTLFRAFLFAFGGICAAVVVHDKMLASILKTPVVFFDTTPIGRIINRFSADVYSVDDSLPFTLNIVLAQTYSLLGSVVITCYGLPWFIIVLVPISVIYYFIQKYYRKTSRELKRIATITLSPIFAHFSESLAGLATIRAFRQTDRFRAENRARVDDNQRATLSSLAATRWLDLRLQLIGVAMVTSVALIAVLQHHFHSVDPGLVGLAMSYALMITGLLNGVVMSFTETEKQMVSVERAHQYISELEHERDDAILSAPPFWPIQGHVAFRQVRLCYRAGLPYALRDVCFETRPAEKVGIVGRTGSGKSSLFRTLFRIVEIEAGQILVDGINISHLPLDQLRSRLAIIPQDPFLFSGSVRDNLDPTGVHGDAALWTVLQRCHLTAAVRRLGGLDAAVAERGRHFSVGQRQLVCLARALLTRAKVLCIDEATASVDLDTDRLIQATIREQFVDNTVLTIAHRVDTVLDCDRVLVMGAGRVLEFGPPAALLADTSSVFYGLVNGTA